jgi:acetate kinase
MNHSPDSLILTINSGSSSIKVSLYRLGSREELVLKGQQEGIGQGEGRFVMKDAAGQALIKQDLSLPDHDAALRTLFDWLKAQDVGGEIGGVGHRVVHGGRRYKVPSLVTPDLVNDVRQLIPFDPLHLPSEIAAIEAVSHVYPEVPQVACFDTSFHRTLPDVARTLAIPKRYAEQGIHRYGFHGLSYEFILEELARVTSPESARGKVVIAHLGSGASMAAVKGGECIDTTMSLTPLGGLVMATRSGDLDPGVVLYLMSVEKLSVEDALRLLNKESGLLGLSGMTADMRTLLDQQDNPHARLAVDIFCYQARKFVAALASALGGLDTLVFTAGIGEHSPPIRSRICEGLAFIGVELDAGRNERNEDVISSTAGRVSVRVMKTNEELMIARHTQRLLQKV